MHDIAIGIVVRDGVLTRVVRAQIAGPTLFKPVQFEVDSPLTAAAHIASYIARAYRHDRVTVYVDDGGAGSATVDAIRDIVGREEHAPFDVQLVSLQGDAHGSIGGQPFHDRVSELVFRYREAVDLNALTIPNIFLLLDQLEAFTEVPGKQKRFLSPLDVERKIGQYPSVAVAALLATIGMRLPVTGPRRVYTLPPDHPDRQPKRTTAADWDPFDPPKGVFDWDPYADI